jgi:hypothetical protein
MAKNIPLNKSLYERVKREAKNKFDVWPSAYASGWLVQEYKRRGGTYEGRKSKDSGLKRWFDEKWIDVCHLPKKKSCGRSTAKSPTKYPYCRPLKRVNKSTPKTVGELSKKELQRRCSAKRKSPSRRVV